MYSVVKVLGYSYAKQKGAHYSPLGRDISRAVTRLGYSAAPGPGPLPLVIAPLKEFITYSL